MASVAQRLSFGLVHHRLWVQIPVTSKYFQCGISKPCDSKHEQIKMSSEMDMMHIGMLHEC